MGRGWFVGAILILSATTYIMAFFIKDILNFFIYLFHFLNYLKPHTPNIWTWPFGVPSQNNSAQPTNDDSENHSGEESGKDPRGSQNQDPAKVMEEGKVIGFTMPPINGPT
jgi:hypothetical protein